MQNYGQNGWTMTDVCYSVYSSVISGGPGAAAPSYSSLLAGENDFAMKQIQNVSGGYAEYGSAVLACAAWLGIPAKVASGLPGKYIAQSSSNTLTGTWAHSDLYWWDGLKSTVAGSTISGKVSGNVIYAGLTASASTNYEVSVAVDGVIQGTYKPQLVYTGVVLPFAPLGVRLPVGGAQNAIHTVTLKCVTPGSTGCYVDWFGGNGLAAHGTPPLAWLGTPFFNLQSGYTAEPFLDMTTQVRNVQALLYGDGLSIYLADTYKTLVGPTQPQTFSDDRHPNAAGDAILATTFEQSMNTLLATNSYVRLTTAGLHNFGYVADGFSVPYAVQITNETGAPVSPALNFSGSPEFTKVSNCPAMLAAGAHCTVDFLFAPEARETGWATATWSLAAPVLAQPQNGGTLEGDAFASPAFTVNTSAHGFGTVSAGSSSPAFGLVLVNPGNQPFAGTLAWSGATGQFSESGNCSLPLAPFSNCVENVAFAPTGAGSQSMTLTITPAGAGAQPRTVTFTGTGR